MLGRISQSALRMLAALALVALLAWFFLIRMPGKKIETAAKLTPDEIVLRDELRASVQKLAGDIGERNVVRYEALKAAATYVEDSFRRAGLTPRRQDYDVQARVCPNIEVEIPGPSKEIVVLGAHYDSVIGAMGANDNGSGVAGMLALAKRFAGQKPAKTLRFVAFVNEEPPFFQTDDMGSLVYAKRCKANGDQIVAMISLETIGYFSDAPGSQKYPSVGLGAFYPTVGNFIGLVSNVGSRTLLRRVMKTFRETEKLPSQGASLPPFIPGVGWSDQWAFWQNGYPGIMVTDTAPFRYPYYHEMTDTPDKLDYDRFALVVSGMERVVADLVK